MTQSKEITVELYTSTLAPGMILKGDCFDDNGTKLIDSSKPVSSEEIYKIKVSGIKKIYYKTSKIFMKNKVTDSIITDQSIGKAMSVLQDIENQLVNNKLNVPSRELRSVVDIFIREIKENNNAYLNLIEVSDLDEYTYSHSINVSTMSIMMGIALNLDNQKVHDLGISGLLMDIGKSMIPKDILYKTGALTPDELKLIRNHPVYGYNLLKNDKDMK